MCDERERLIGFVYDECDAGERRQIESHLESCGTCRQEIAGLRSVRQDLLAWSVPEHQPVWRPIPVAIATPWWRQTPGWAFAAAAGLVLMTGVAGGAATQAIRATQASAPAPAGVTAADLGAVEQQILKLMRSELDRLQAATPAQVPAAVGVDPAVGAALEQRLATKLDESDRKSFDFLKDLWKDFDTIRAGYDERLRKLTEEIEALKAAALERQGGGR